MSGQLDKFPSGAHGVKNAAGISRKDIINQTFTDMRDRFNYTGTKTALNLQITDRAGKCIGTRTIRINNNPIHVPVYDKGGDGAAADYAMAYIAGFNDGVDEWEIFRLRFWFLVTEYKLLQNEFDAWHAYQENYAGMAKESLREVAPELVEGLDLQKMREGAAPFIEYFKKKMEDAKKNARTPLAGRRIEAEIMANKQEYLLEWMKENNTNPLDFLKSF